MQDRYPQLLAMIQALEEKIAPAEDKLARGRLMFDSDIEKLRNLVELRDRYVDEAMTIKPRDTYRRYPRS